MKTALLRSSAATIGRVRERKASGWILGLVWLSIAASSIPAAWAEPLRASVSPGVVAVLDGELGFEVVPETAEGLLALAERICGDRALAELIASANDGERSLRAGVRYRVPWGCAKPSLRELGLERLFPGDRPSTDEWLHTVGAARSDGVETLWRISLWFTGKGENYREIRQHNGFADESIEAGQIVRIPRTLLQPSFVALMPKAPQPAPLSGRPSPAAMGATADLQYGQDQGGRYASYRLRSGEALYSSVVIRFTGRLLAEDVNPLATVIARRSDIKDITDIPVGYEIKIPLEYLTREYLPIDDPQRQEYEQQKSASALYTNRVRSTDLRGVTVILDAGHGGLDVGSASGGIWESVYVYDIMERVKRQLQLRTAARVVATTLDGTGYSIPDRDVLSLSRAHRVMTTPAYENQDSSVSANLRWAMSNSLLRRLEKEGTAKENVVFLSIHADWLHPSVRGSMIYVPGLLPIRSNYRLTGDIYRNRREVRELAPVSFTEQERVKSLGLSQDLAEGFIGVFKNRGLRVHPNQPVRDRIYRGSRPWVPAVLKYNEVPAKVLVEVCNLANAEDLALMKSQTFREEFAVALVDGLLAYYETSTATVRASAGD